MKVAAWEVDTKILFLKSVTYETSDFIHDFYSRYFGCDDQEGEQESPRTTTIKSLRYIMYNSQDIEKM